MTTSTRNRIFGGSAVATVLALSSIVGSLAAESDYSVRAVPSPQPMDLSSVGNTWNYAQSMLQDVLSIVSNQPILVVLLVALPLVGIGIGLFKRIIN